MGISKTAIIHEGVIIGKNVIIHDFVAIYSNTIIGDNVEIYEGCVIGRKPSLPNKGSASSANTDFKSLVVGSNTIVCPGVVLYAGSQIGSSTLIGDNSSIRENCSIGNNCVVGRHVGINHGTKVGNNVHIMDGCRITDMTIEDDVFISAQVATAGDNTFGESYNPYKGPFIKKGARIGVGAILLPEIVVGENAIIAAGAVVTKNVPDNQSVFGVPAKQKIYAGN